MKKHIVGPPPELGTKKPFPWIWLGVGSAICVLAAGGYLLMQEDESPTMAPASSVSQPPDPIATSTNRTEEPVVASMIAPSGVPPDAAEQVAVSEPPDPIAASTHRTEESVAASTIVPSDMLPDAVEQPAVSDQAETTVLRTDPLGSLRFQVTTPDYAEKHLARAVKRIKVGTDDWKDVISFPLEMNVAAGEPVDVALEAEGFEPVAQRVTVADTQTERVSFTLVPKPALLSVGCNVENAVVHLAGKVVKLETPVAVPSLLPVRMEITAPGHRPRVVRSSALAPGAKDRHDVTLEKAEGLIQVSCTAPEYAEKHFAGAAKRVKIGAGDWKGVSAFPLELHVAADEPVDVTLEAEGFEPVVQRVTVADDQTEEVSFTLAPNPASLTVGCNVSSAVVRLGSEIVALDTPVAIPSLRSLAMEINAPGHREQVLKLNALSPGATERRDITLQKAEGQIRVACIAPDYAKKHLARAVARVKVGTGDWKEVSGFPLDLKVAAGKPVDVTLEAEGFEPVVQRVTVADAQTQEVSFTLMPKAALQRGSRSAFSYMAAYQRFSDADAGMGALASIDYPLLGTDFLLNVRGGWLSGFDWEFQQSSSALSELDREESFHVTVYPVEMGLLYGYSRKGVQVYVGAGAGYYFFDDDAHTKRISGTSAVSTPSGTVNVPYAVTVTAEIEDDFGYYALLGLKKSIMEQLAVFLEAKYLMLKPSASVRVVSEDGSTTQTLRSTVNFEGMGVNMGVSYLW